MYPQHLAGVWPAIESTDAAPPQRPILTAAQWADRIGCDKMRRGGQVEVFGAQEQGFGRQHRPLRIALRQSGPKQKTDA